VGGQYQWRDGGEYHLFNPQTIHNFNSLSNETAPNFSKEYFAIVNDSTNVQRCAFARFQEGKAGAD